MNAIEPHFAPASPALSCVYRPNGQIDLSLGDVASVELIGLAQHGAADRVIFVHVFVDGESIHYYGGRRERETLVTALDLGVHVFTESTYDQAGRRTHVQRVAGAPNLVQVLKRIQSNDADGLLPLVLSRNADQKNAASAARDHETGAAGPVVDNEQIVLAVNRYFAREARSETVIGFPVESAYKPYEQSAPAS